MKKLRVKVVGNSVKSSNFVNESFHEAVGPCLAFGQFYGILPVVGVTEPDVYKLKFKWNSLRTIYSLFFIILGGIDSCAGIHRFFRKKFNIGFAEALLFFISGITKFTFLFILATQWRKIMKKWFELEKPFLHSPYKGLRGWKLKTRIRVNFFVLIIISIGKKSKL